MHHITRDLRSLPVWLLCEYLEELGGRLGADDCISGTGWEARLSKLDDFVIGSLRVGQIRLEWHGTEEAYQTTWPMLEKKLIRAGG